MAMGTKVRTMIPLRMHCFGDNDDENAISKLLSLASQEYKYKETMHVTETKNVKKVKNAWQRVLKRALMSDRTTYFYA